MIARVVNYARHRLEEMLMLTGISLLGFAASAPDPTVPCLFQAVLFSVSTLFILFHTYSFNDWAHYHLDAADQNKKGRADRFVSLNEALALSLLAFVIGMGAYALFFPRATLLLCLGLLLLWVLYSSRLTRWKSVPVLSTALHLVAGTLYFAMGCSLVAPLTGKVFAAGVFFGILYAGGHLSHETIDFEGDRAAGMRTSATRFGKRRAFQASFIAMTLGTAYVSLLSARGIVYPPASAAVFLLAYLFYCFFFRLVWKGGLDYAGLCRFRSRYRKLYSLAGVLVLIIFILGS